MRPLNYALLKYFTEVEKASSANVMEALADEYSTFKAFTKASIEEALMTAEKNGLIEEVDYDLNENDELITYYTANEESRKTINHYIKD